MAKQKAKADDIRHVTTKRELHEVYGVALSTLQFAIWRDEIEAWQSGSTWLIDTRSFLKWWIARKEQQINE